MTIEDDNLLAEFRSAGCCEICGKFCKARDPHHWCQTGLGGGSRLDIRENLLAVCRECHMGIHAGQIGRVHTLFLLAQREGKKPEEIQEYIWQLLRKPK